MDNILTVTLEDIKRILMSASEAIASGEIYEHGYPESRLIPPNFYEDCEDGCIGYVNDDISVIVDEYLRGFIRHHD